MPPAPGLPRPGAARRSSLQHSSLFRMERGDDLFRQDLGRPEDFYSQDIPCIAELDGDSWRDLDRARNLSLLAEKIQHISPYVISGFGFCRHAIHLPFLIFLSTSRSSSG